MSILEIARRTGLSRNTVKKYLRAGDNEPRYAKRTSSSKLDPYAERLSTWLAIEATKSRKQRRNLRQIHTLLDAVAPPSDSDGICSSRRSWALLVSPSRARDQVQPATQDLTVKGAGSPPK
jgi:transcriptional regulator with XRE-family HTH domain